ncbi:MAG: ABC transporter substrate-binding protein [Sarcina sp.]
MKLKKVKLISLILAAMMMVSCSATGKKDEGNKGEDNKVLVYGSSDYEQINPAIKEHGEINSLIFSGLTAHDENNKIVPALAKDWSFDREKNSYKFNLRDDVKWHDGERFTAEDVKFTIEAINDEKNQSEIASNYEDIVGVNVIDEKTVEIVLKAPNVAILDYLTVGILPKHLLEGKDLTTDGFNQKPIGTGPYKLESWDRGQNIVLVKNEEYYKSNPKIDKVIFKIVEDSKAKVMQLKSGELDLAQVTPKDINSFKEDENYIVDIMKTSDYRGIMYNFNSELFKENKLLPNALSYGINRKEIVDTVLLGHGVSAYSPLQMGPYNNENIEKFEYNTKKAEEEIEKLGFKKASDGIYEKEGKKLSFEIVCGEGDQVRIDMATIAAQQLKAIGVDAKVAIKAKIDWANQDSYLIGWGSPFDPDDHSYKVFGTEKGANYNSYSNKKVDEILQKARETSDDEERVKYYKEFQEELVKEMPYSFIAYIDAIYVRKANVKGITKDTVLGHHGVGIFWNIENWTID